MGKENFTLTCPICIFGPARGLPALFLVGALASGRRIQAIQWRHFHSIEYPNQPYDVLYRETLVSPIGMVRLGFFVFVDGVAFCYYAERAMGGLKNRY